MYKYYQSADHKRAADIKKTILNIAMATQSQEAIDQLLKNNP